MKGNCKQWALLVGLISLSAGVPIYAEEVRSGFDTLPLMESAQLDELRGRSVNTNVQSIQDLDAVVTGGAFTADSITTGAITIESRALENFDGVGLFNLMTGHNNSVNSAVGISVYVTQ